MGGLVSRTSPTPTICPHGGQYFIPAPTCRGDYYQQNMGYNCRRFPDEQGELRCVFCDEPAPFVSYRNQPYRWPEGYASYPDTPMAPCQTEEDYSTMKRRWNEQVDARVRYWENQQHLKDSGQDPFATDWSNPL